MWLRFGVTDHMAAAASVYATLLGLYRRGRGGGGQKVSASLLGAALLTQAEAVGRPDGSVTAMPRLDSGQTGLSPEQRIYRCTDDWLAVAAIEPAEVKAFRDLAGADPEAFFARRAATDALGLMTDAGVPNAAVRENQLEPFFENPGHAAAGLHAHYRHARYGRMDQVGAFWNFGDLPLKLDRPPPALGEHTREVLLERGLSGAEIDGLIAGGLAAAC